VLGHRSVPGRGVDVPGPAEPSLEAGQKRDERRRLRWCGPDLRVSSPGFGLFSRLSRAFRHRSGGPSSSSPSVLQSLGVLLAGGAERLGSAWRPFGPVAGAVTAEGAAGLAGRGDRGLEPGVGRRAKARLVELQTSGR